MTPINWAPINWPARERPINDVEKLMNLSISLASMWKKITSYTANWDLKSWFFYHFTRGKMPYINFFVKTFKYLPAFHFKTFVKILTKIGPIFLESFVTLNWCAQRAWKKWLIFKKNLQYNNSGYKPNICTIEWQIFFVYESFGH